LGVAHFANSAPDPFSLPFVVEKRSRAFLAETEKLRVAYFTNSDPALFSFPGELELKTEPIELLNGEFRPITDTIGFFECHAKTAADAFYAWRDRTYSRDGRQLQITRIEGESLPKVLSTLLPLTSRTCRWLFIETKSDWCAYFSNGWRGTDPTGIAPLGGVGLSCRSSATHGIRTIANPSDPERVTARQSHVDLRQHPRPCRVQHEASHKLHSSKLGRAIARVPRRHAERSWRVSAGNRRG